MSAEKLLPCPFCGGHPVTTEAMGENWVSCGTCTASATMKGKLKEACEAWNRRTPPAMSADHIGDATNMVAPVEAVAWTTAAEIASLAKGGAGTMWANRHTNDSVPLYTHPAPIKPSVDTGELRERVAAILTRLPVRDCVEPGGELDGLRIREAADAILDLIQSKRAG